MTIDTTSLKVGDSITITTNRDSYKRKGKGAWTGLIIKEHKKSFQLALSFCENPDNRWFPLLDKRTGKLR